MNLIQRPAGELSGEKREKNFNDGMLVGTQSVSGQYWIFQPSSNRDVFGSISYFLEIIALICLALWFSVIGGKKSGF